jgi:hypothetical protein
MGDVTQGGCHCGAVTVAAKAPARFQFICHCDSCSTLNGGMRLAGMSFRADDIAVTGPVSTYTYQGGKAAIDVAFCGTCGTPILATPHAFAGMKVLRANCLADRSQFVPQKSIFVETACAWEQLVGV